jgi:hypothetical protein
VCYGSNRQLGTFIPYLASCVASLREIENKTLLSQSRQGKTEGAKKEAESQSSALILELLGDCYSITEPR